MTLIFEYHDSFKGHIRLERTVDGEGKELYELHIGSRQIGFDVDGEWLYSETNYSSPADGGAGLPAPGSLVPAQGWDGDVCVECAQYGIDSGRASPTDGRGDTPKE